MAQGLQLGLGIPLWAGYAAATLIIFPLVIYGMKVLSKLQLWTTPLWLILMVLPFAYLRFMPPKTPENARQWWSAMLLAGPGWVIFGAIKQVIGLFLAVYLIATVAGGAAFANQPVQQFLEIYQGFMPHWPLRR
jgi:hypothetical protein